MKIAAVDSASELGPGSVTPKTSRGGLFSDYAELVKARLTLLVLLTTAVGFIWARPARLTTRAFFMQSSAPPWLRPAPPR